MSVENVTAGSSSRERSSAEADDDVVPAAEPQEDPINEADEVGDEDEGGDSYQESTRFKTWRKHVKDLYQTSVHIDTVWESPPAQFMPFMTHNSSEHVACQTILCGTRTGGTEQNYLQLATVSLPTDVSMIEEVGFHETTGEVGGYGMAPAQCNFRVERRIAHSGDVLAARYMHANPLVLGTCSSDGNVYIFDWSRISLLKPPNKPERPLGPLPPNAITESSTPEEKAAFQRRMKVVREVLDQQSAWDQKTHPPQHMLSLSGSVGVPTTMDFETSTEGKLIAGSNGRVCMWQVGQLPKDVIPKPGKPGEPRPQPALESQWSFTDLGADSTSPSSVINDVKFQWGDANVVYAASQRGILFHGDLRQPGMDEFCLLPDGVGASCVAVPYFDDVNLLFVGGTDGYLRTYDRRRPGATCVSAPIACHQGYVTVAQCCPHAGDLIATGGEDGFCTIFNVSSGQLLFKHSAHVSNVTDIGWNWQEMFAGQLISTDSTSITVWKPRDMFFDTA